jgi:hypothetical protein
MFIIGSRGGRLARRGASYAELYWLTALVGGQSIAGRTTGPRTLHPLANDPFADPGRALSQLNALVFTADEEANHCEVYKGDFVQVQDYGRAAIVHCRPNAR